MTTEVNGPLRGWYDDPEDAGTVRYWDGNRWTESRAPVTTPDEKPEKAGFETVDGVGYVMAVLFPLVGFIMGLVRLNKSKQGVWIVVVSVLAFIIWLAIFTADAGSQTYR